MIQQMTNLAQQVIFFTEEIQQIAAPTFFEKPRALFMRDQFTQIGLQDVQIDEVGNVVGVYKGGNQHPLILSAHLDSVHPLDTPLDIIRTPGQISAPGIGDNALGLASLLGIASYLVSQNKKCAGNIIFIANVCEEGKGNLLGMHRILDQYGNSALAFIVIEGIGLGYIQNQALGIERFSVEISTKGGHSWIDYGIPSAVHEMGKMINDLARLNLSKKYRSSLNIGLIKGGSAINTIASSSQMELDVRSEDQLTLHKIVEKITKIIKKYETEDVKINIICTGKKPSGKIAPDHPFILLCKKALEEQGIPPFLITSSTDASLPISKGLPAACLAITTGKNVHSRDETIDLRPIPIGLSQILYVIDHVWEFPGLIPWKTSD